jgi:hypothetical protein
MAGIGPAPKDPSQRRRRNADPIAGAVLPAEGPDGPTPDLPGGHDYDTRTLDWYETWRHSPQAALFLATDWQRLRMLAELVEQYWKLPTKKELLSEIRLNEASLGATAADRARLRWSVGESESSEPRKRTAGGSAASRRDRVLKVIDGGQAG